MAYDSHCNILPFYGLNNCEFRQLIEPDSNRLARMIKDSHFKEHIMRILEQNMPIMNECQYYTEERLRNVIEHNKFELSILHLNIRSMDKHLGELMAFIANLDFNFDVIALTEIGAKNIPNRLATIRDRYTGEYMLPKTNRYGGACILVKKGIEYIILEMTYV